MKYRWIIYIFFFLFFTNCKVDKGSPVIKENQMAEILTEIYLTQATLEQNLLPKEEKKQYYYCNVLEKHGVTEPLFDSAVAWYASNMDIFEQVYANVIVKLDKEKEKLKQQNLEKQ